MCQDTGTAIVLGKREASMDFRDKEAISEGIAKTYASDNLRFSQLSLSMFEEKNTDPIFLLKLIYCIRMEMNIIFFYGKRRWFSQ